MNEEKTTVKQRRSVQSVESTPKTGSRAERKALKEKKKEAEFKKTFWVQIRILPIWLRVILVILLLAGAAALGLIVGYGYIGDGDPADILKKEIWIHILNIIKGKES